MVFILFLGCLDIIKRINYSQSFVVHIMCLLNYFDEHIICLDGLFSVMNGQAYHSLLHMYTNL